MQDDLDLAVENAAREAIFLESQHEAIRCFVGKRSSAPGEGEPVSDVTPKGHVKSLHVGTGRAATIYDSDVDVCWLLAYSGTHATHERRDAYQHFMWLDGRNELLPTPDDYVALETVTDASLMDTLRAHASVLYKRALSTDGEEAFEVIELVDGRDLKLTLAVEVVVVQNEGAEQGWCVVTFAPDTPLSADVILDLLADLLPEHVEPDAVSRVSMVRDRVVRFNEIAVAWDAYYSTP